MKKSFLILLCSLLLAGNASADLFTGGGGMSVADTNPGGLSSGTLNVGTVGTIASYDNLIINMTTQHTWLGDITFTLQSPTGTQVQIMRRQGASGVGNSGDMQVGLHTFVDNGTGANMPFTNTATNMAGGTVWNRSNNAASTQIIPAVNPNTYASFAGQVVNGTWTLFALDSAGGDVGVVGDWSMNITLTAIPEPGSLALLSVFGLVGLARRRRV